MLPPVVLGPDFGGTKTVAAVGVAAAGGRLGSAPLDTRLDAGAYRNLRRGVAAARRLPADVAGRHEPVAVASRSTPSDPTPLRKGLSG